jgi:hypothetical protein
MRHIPENLEDDPIRQHANSILHLSKEDAARRHIEAAVKSWHDGDFDIAITLAGAADGMTKGDVEDTLYRQLMARLPPGLDQKQARENLNASRSWLKHTTPHLQASRSFTFIESGLHIMFAANRWGFNDNPSVQAMASLWEFMVRFMLENGDAPLLVERMAAIERTI